MNRISRRTFLQISASATAGALLAACGKKMETPTEVPATEAPQAAATATPKPQPSFTPIVEKVWPRENVARNRTLASIFNIIHPAGIGNPYASGYTHQCGGAAQMEALFYYVALNDKTWPWLAESYAYNADATECTVHLRKGIKWNDGTPFTAKDVAFTYNFLIKFAPAISDSVMIKKNIDKVEELDDTTVKFTLPESNYRFHFLMCTYRMDRGVYLIPEHIFKDFETAEAVHQFKQWDPDAGVHPVHTGPYLLARTEEDFTEYHLRYEWWAHKTGLVERMPWVEAITYVPPFDDPGLIAQLFINDEIDVTVDLPPQLMPVILKDKEGSVVLYTGFDKPYGYIDWWPISMYFNCLEKPYDDVRVRWALAYAIDQEQLVEVAWSGAGAPTATPFPNYPSLLKYIEGAKEILTKYNVLERDLNKVDTLMTDAGFTKDEEGFWVDTDGARLEADIHTALPMFADLGPIVAEMLRQAGFYATPVTPADIWAAMNDGRALLHFMGHGGSVIDPYQTMQMYHSRWKAPTGEDCSWNRPRWSNDAYDVIVDEMYRTNPEDTETMQDLFNRGMEIWYRELPEVPLVQWFHRVAMSTTYWTGWPSKDNPYNTAQWHLTFPITLWHLEPTT